MNTTTKTPTLNKDYGELFGYDSQKGKQLVYVGGISFRIINRDKGVDVVKDSQPTYDAIIKRINATHISMGAMA